ncbi:MAG: hypothetical protein FJZ56_01125 [Chlamydiae bacterium]|nr:hypothetical protein [Chlamydiota bacterium]
MGYNVTAAFNWIRTVHEGSGTVRELILDENIEGLSVSEIYAPRGNIFLPMLVAANKNYGVVWLNGPGTALFARDNGPSKIEAFFREFEPILPSFDQEFGKIDAKTLTATKEFIAVCYEKGVVIKNVKKESTLHIKAQEVRKMEFSQESVSLVFDSFKATYALSNANKNNR